MGLMESIAQQPVWLQVWMGWMGFINLAAILFVWKTREARWALAAFLASAMTMSGLYEIFGYERILGLAHVLFWTPLLIWLFGRRKSIGRRGAPAIYLHVLFATIGLSLVVDYYDVATFLIGLAS